MVLDLILPIFVNLKALTLIVGGLLAASWLVVRIAGVSSEDISGMVDKIAILGFPVGIIAFLTIGAGIFLISNSSTSDYPTFDILTVVCLGILGIVLILRPIKDFRFGTIISLAIGLLGAGLLVFLGAESIKLLSVFFIILFFTIFGAIKIFEDLYLLIAEILS
ncbi:MAG: hypothetical protein ACW97X_11505, partial [Candidatus Hodarchaeales archaeon]